MSAPGPSSPALRYLVLAGASIIDVTTATASPPMSLIIGPLDTSPTLIADIRPDTSMETLARDWVSQDTSTGNITRHFQRIDLSGHYISPGLIDCHVHLSVVPGVSDLSRLASITPAQSLLRQPALCRSVLARGFTAVRDCGGASYALKEALASEAFPGPRLYMAGKALSQTGGHADLRGPHDESGGSGGANAGVSGGGSGGAGSGGGCMCGGHANVFGRVCNGVPECLHAARDELRRGADFIKIMAGGGVMSPTDRLLGLQFSRGEIGAIVEVARNAGTYVTAHAYTSQAARLCLDGGVRGIEHGNLLDRDTLRYMAAQKAFLTPTLVTYKMLAGLGRGEIDPEMARKNKLVLEAGLESVKVADEEGVTICYGSDLLGDHWSAQTGEFAIRAQVLDAGKVLRSATANAAELIMEGHRMGVLKKGYLADLIVLKRNPLEDITVLDRPEENLMAVIKGGVVYGSRIEGLECRGRNVFLDD